MRLTLCCVALLAFAGAAEAGATCAPVDTSAKIYASASKRDVHPDWRGGNRVGLSWSLDLQGDDSDARGNTYLYGDLIDPRGNVVTEGVYVSDLEWECEPN